MSYNHNTRGWKRGKQQIVHRRQKMASAMKDVTRISVPVAKLNMLQRLRFASDYILTLAEREREKGDRADVTLVVEMMERGALLAAKAAPYVHPKLLAMAYVKPQRHSLDLTKLTDDELSFLGRITVKAGMQSEAKEFPRTPDQYLASTAPSPPPATHDGHEEVEPPDARSTDNFDDQA